LSDGWLQTGPVSSRSRTRYRWCAVKRTRFDRTRYRGTVPWNVLLERSLTVELLAPVPTPRAVWLVEPRSVESDLSRPLSFSQAPPSSGPIANRQLPAPSIGLRRCPASPTCENRAPTPRGGLGRMKHERDAFRRVVRRALARSPDPRGSGFDPTVSRTAHPFVTPPLLLDRPHGQPKPDILWIPVRERVARRVRAIVTRLVGGPASRLSTRTRSTNQRCERPTSAQSLESIGHPDPRGFRALYPVAG
jgi:hypothetical protein